MKETVEKVKIAIVHVDEQGRRKCEHIIADASVQDILLKLDDYVESHEFKIVNIGYEYIEVEEEWDPSAYENNNSTSNSNEETEL